MGCVSSKGDINDRHPNVFHVWNVDDLGNVLVPGRIEITETELVLHQRGNREPVRWPMRCLRRYGFETELFSFESGRRCATGAGIYAFRCRRAEALFNLLQEYIQCCGQEDGITTTGTGLHSTNTVTTGGASILSGNGNGMAMAAAAAANGGSLRPSSVLSSSLSNPGPDANYLEPIVRNRTRSATSRDGLAHIATLSLPNNLAQAAGGITANGNVLLSPSSTNNDADMAEQHGYMNDPAATLLAEAINETDRGSVDGSSSQRSPLTPPVTASWTHEYANTTTPAETDPSDDAPSTDVVANGHPLSCGVSNGSTRFDANGECEPHESRRTALYSLLDLRRRRHPHKNSSAATSATAAALASATNTSMAGSGISAPPGISGSSTTGRRQVVLLRGHSLDDDGANNYARLDDLLRHEAHLYMNVIPDGSAAKRRDKTSSMLVGGAHREHFYANVAPSSRVECTEETKLALCGGSAGGGESNVVVGSSGGSGPTKRSHQHSYSLGGIAGLVQRSAASQHVNYAVLDLNHRGSSSSGGSGSIGGGVSSSTAAVNGTSSGDTAPTSPTGQSPPVETMATTTSSPISSLAVSGREMALEGYATIDFDKTKALSSVQLKTAALSNTVSPDSAVAGGVDDEAVRRTRHDANINDVMPQLLMGGRQQLHGGSIAGD